MTHPLFYKDNQAHGRPLWLTVAALTLVTIFAGCKGGGDGGKPSGLSPQDPMFKYQWHLKNTGQSGSPYADLRGTPGVDINVMPVWQQGIGGDGVTLAVLDGGLEINHADLKSNVVPGLSHDYVTGSADPTPIDTDDSHGTMVAGTIAATMNDIGGVGVAPLARLAGFNIFGATGTSAATLQDAFSRGVAAGDIDISNNSWGPAIRGTVGGIRLDAAARTASRYGVNQGRQGKGVIYLFAAGNDCLGPVCQLPGYGLANFDLMREPQLLAICALDANGKPAYYSSPGSNLLLCAPSSGDSTVPGITTTKPFSQYTHVFGGTSAAAPEISGVVALMLQANPNLTWRDVRLILARTARILPEMEVDPGADPRLQWITTKATNPRTGAPYRYSLVYGFGLVDAEAAVAYAKTFQSVGGSSDNWWKEGCTNTNQPQVGMTTRIPMACDNRKVELAEISIGLVHPRFRDLEITLTTPQGTQVPLTAPFPECGAPPLYRCPTSDFNDVYRTSFTVALDEPATGDWILNVVDHGNTGTANIVRSVALTIH